MKGIFHFHILPTFLDHKENTNTQIFNTTDRQVATPELCPLLPTYTMHIHKIDFTLHCNLFFILLRTVLTSEWQSSSTSSGRRLTSVPLGILCLLLGTTTYPEERSFIGSFIHSYLQLLLTLKSDLNFNILIRSFCFFDSSTNPYPPSSNHSFSRSWQDELS